MDDPDIIIKSTVDSTNEEAGRLLQKGRIQEWTVIMAEYQEAGKGIGGNSWESEPGKNLLFSLILQPEFLPPEKQFYLNMALSLGITRSIRTGYNLPAMIKWPNDLYINGKKLGGILMQNFISGGKIGHCIAGVGINVNQVLFPDHIPNPVSLNMLTGKEIQAGSLLDEILRSVRHEYMSLKAGDLTHLRDGYLQHLYLFERVSSYRIRGEEMNATIKDLDPYGRLQLESEQGEMFTCDLKEVVYL